MRAARHSRQGAYVKLILHTTRVCPPYRHLTTAHAGVRAQRDTPEVRPQRVMQMSEQSTLRFTAIAASVVGVSALLYGIVFLVLVPEAQKGPAPASLISFAHNPTGRQIANVLLVIGGLAGSAAVVGIYRRLRATNAGLAVWSLVLGSMYCFATILHGIYFAFLMVDLSRLYARGGEALKASAVAIASTPSPLGVGDYFLAGPWLLVTGLLMVRSPGIPRALGYLAWISAVGLFVEFAGTVIDTPAVIRATAVPGALVVGLVFWVWTGCILWTSSAPE